MREVEQHIVSEVHGQVGFITLNRPKAINALSPADRAQLLA